MGKSSSTWTGMKEPQPSEVIAARWQWSDATNTVRRVILDDFSWQEDALWERDEQSAWRGWNLWPVASPPP